MTDEIPLPVRELFQDLEAHPCLSGAEEPTVRRLIAFFETHMPRIQLRVEGERMLAAIFPGAAPGPDLVLRADTDAVLVSGARGRSVPRHACGHSGHTAALCWVALHLAANGSHNGRIILLFQPSEETGEGAAAVLSSGLLPDLVNPVFAALHNLPGFESGVIYHHPECFALSSVGTALVFEGTSAHAAYPEEGKSPIAAIRYMLTRVAEMQDYLPPGDLVTVTYVQVGASGFGTSPGSARMGLTLRSPSEASLFALERAVRMEALRASRRDGLKLRVRRRDPFPATRTTPGLVDIILPELTDSGLTVSELSSPMRWSEDFGRYSEYGGAIMFGIGAGVDMAPLHSPAYRFPEELLSVMVRSHLAIIRAILV